jgi:hypothetical protein
MITDSNQACITKMSGCGFQEGAFRKVAGIISTRQRFESLQRGKKYL